VGNSWWAGINAFGNQALLPGPANTLMSLATTMTQNPGPYMNWAGGTAGINPSLLSLTGNRGSRVSSHPYFFHTNSCLWGPLPFKVQILTILTFSCLRHKQRTGSEPTNVNSNVNSTWPNMSGTIYTVLTLYIVLTLYFELWPCA
jgi:hypothetical protein